MDYIYQSTIHFSKGDTECVLKCTKIPENKPMVICPRRTDHKLNANIRNLVMVLTKKGGIISTHALCLITNS